MSIWGIPVREHVASISVPNVNLSSQVFINTWSQWTSSRNVGNNNATRSNCNCPSLVIGITRSSLISTDSFLHHRGSILVCKYDGHKQHSLASTSRTRWLDLPSSLALFAAPCHVLNYSISSPPQLAPNTIITCKYAIGLKSAKHKHSTLQLKPVLQYILSWPVVTWDCPINLCSSNNNLGDGLWIKPQWFHVCTHSEGNKSTWQLCSPS